MTDQHGALTTEDSKILQAPFRLERVGIKVQSFNKERTRAMLVAYLGHIDVQGRLSEVDPSWTCEVLEERSNGQSVIIRQRMTLKGVSREDYGEGQDPKSAKSDAIKRCAMRFGVGGYIYDWPTPWVEYSDQRDRYKQWTIHDYINAIDPAYRKAVLETDLGFHSGSAPAGGGPTPEISRSELNRKLLERHQAFLKAARPSSMAEVLRRRYNKTETKVLDLVELRDLADYMEAVIKTASGSPADQSPQSPAAKAEPLVTQPQITRLFTIAQQAHWSDSEVQNYIFAAFGLDSTKKLTRSQYDQVVGAIEGLSPEAALSKLDTQGTGASP